MKANNILLCSLVVAAVWACQPNTDNNQDLDFDEIEVNFSASSNAVSFSTEDEIGILAYCTTGGGTENQVMKDDETSSGMSRQIPLSDGSPVLLEKATEQDALIARKGDHNFRFYGVYPYMEGDFDVTAIPMSVPVVQNFKEGIKSQMTLVASKTSTNVVPTQELEFRSFFSVINFKIAQDIMAEGETSVLRKITLSPANEALLEDPLAVDGVCDMEKMTFAPDPETGSKSVSVDFGTEGYELQEEFTDVPMLVNPFYVPDGGLKLKIEDIDGAVVTLDVFATQEDNGKEIAGGQVFEVIVDGISDGIVPVEWPVVFPLGFPDGNTAELGWCNKDKYQTKWCNASDLRGDGLWTCQDQPAAYAQWIWADGNDSFNPAPFLETINSTGSRVSTVGVKGAWTGDCLEFTIPVKKFKAGSKVTFSIPICCKNSPVFWEVKYLDGDEWKTTATTEIPAYEGSDVKRKATWALQFGGAKGGSAMQSVTMIFENEIKSGYLKVRLECVDGSIVMSADKTLREPLTQPYNSKGKCQGNFYFAEHMPNTATFALETAATFTLN